MAAQDALLPPVIMEAWRSCFLSPYRRPILKVHLGVPLHSLVRGTLENAAKGK